MLRLLKRIILRVIPAVLLLEAVVVVTIYAIERSRLCAIEREVTYGNPGAAIPPIQLWHFEMRGLQEPHTEPATAAKVADGDEVIGVVVKGKPRAYWLKARQVPTLAYRQRCGHGNSRLGDLL